MVTADLECGTEYPVSHVCQTPTDDDHFRVQDIYHGGEPYAGEIGRPVQDLDGKGVAGLSRLEDDLGVDGGGVVAAQCGFAAFIDLTKNLPADRGAGGEGLPAALLSATALGTVDHQLDVTHLTCGAPCASNQSVIGYDSCSDAGAEGHVGHVSSPFAHADSMLGDCGGVGVVFKGYGEGQLSLEHISEGNGGELREVGGIDEGSGHGVDRARRGYSDGDRTTGADLFQETTVHRTDCFDHGLGWLVCGGGATGLGDDGRWGIGEGGAKGGATYVDAKY